MKAKQKVKAIEQLAIEALGFDVCILHLLKNESPLPPTEIPSYAIAYQTEGTHVFSEPKGKNILIKATMYTGEQIKDLIDPYKSLDDQPSSIVKQYIAYKDRELDKLAQAVKGLVKETVDGAIEALTYKRNKTESQLEITAKGKQYFVNIVHSKTDNELFFTIYRKSLTALHPELIRQGHSTRPEYASNVIIRTITK